MNQELERRIDRLAAQTLSNFFCKYCGNTECDTKKMCECLKLLKRYLKTFAQGKKEI